jgi:16S rRNA (cytosine1402-N4)-methyltransferase
MTHIPVLLHEMLEALAPAQGGVFVDATYGGGGYTDELLKTGASVIGLDRDPDAEKRAVRHRDQKGFTFIRAAFADMQDVVTPHAPDGVDGVVLDIGVSSFQIDEAARGFSFNTDGPLDMRMDNENGPSAADLVNTLAEEDLANIFYRYGEERHSRRVARAVVAARPFTRTAQLAAVIEKAMPKSREKMHPATRCFQALRIAVNDELGELERGLVAAEALLKDGGRLVVVTFHSLEDRIVKQFFSERSGRQPKTSRYLPEAANENKVTLKLLSTKPITPSEEELRRNPRARSAKLRAAVKVAA